MKQYKVEITKEALQDMEDIYNYIAIDLLAPDNAMEMCIRDRYFYLYFIKYFVSSQSVS